MQQFPDPNSPTPPPSTGMSTGAKIGIGCGVFAIIAVVLIVLLIAWCTNKFGDVIEDFKDNPERATAELAIRLNPDLELVKSDNEAGTTTFRDKTGKETTLSWADIADGKLTITDSEGNETTIGTGNLDAVPEWVPRLPQITQVVTTHRSVEGGKITGSFAIMTKMSNADIVAFLTQHAESREMENTIDNEFSSGSGQMRSMTYAKGGRTFNTTISRDGENDAQVQFTYEEKPED